MRIITTEEHLAGTPIHRHLAKYAAEDAPYGAMARIKGRPFDPDPVLFADLDQRIRDLDRHGITMQILSCPVKSQLLPPGEAPALVRETNDYVWAAVQRHPDRYGAFALLPWSAPAEAVKETQRIKGLGYHGVVLVGRASRDSEFLDHRRFWPILEACEALNLPVFVHPGAPLKAVQEPYYGGLGEEVSARLSMHGWGWHNEAGVQILRTILAGVFDRFPRLRLIAGHWGEMLPFFLSRLDQSLPRAVTGLDRTITETFRENVYVTPSGMFDYPQLKFCLEVLGAGRILHAADCPFLSNEGVRAFVEQAPIPQEEKEKIAFRNAEALFGLSTE